MNKNFATATKTWLGGVVLGCFAVAGQAWAADIGPDAMVQKVAGETLAQIKADQITTLLVLNKIDLLPEEEALTAGAVLNAEGTVVAMHTSVHNGVGLQDLRDWMAEQAQAHKQG